MKKFSIFAALTLLLSSCGSNPKPEPAPEVESNLFYTVVSVENDSLAPKVTPFLTNRKRVMDIFLHDRSTVLFLGRKGDTLIRDIVIDGVTWREIFGFYGDSLIAVSYVMRPGPETKEEFEEIGHRLVEEAEVFMPEELLMNANGIQVGKGHRTYWRDELGGRVTLSFSNTVTREEQPSIGLEIWLESTSERLQKIRENF